MKTILIVLFTCSLAFAHEGDDHDMPATVKAPKGGIIKTLEETHVEVLNRDKKLYIYIYDLKLIPKSTKGFKLNAQAKLPRKSKLQDIKLSVREKMYEADFNPSVHRYTLVLKITDPATGHNDVLNYIIEPKR